MQYEAKATGGVSQTNANRNQRKTAQFDLHERLTVGGLGRLFSLGGGLPRADGLLA